MSFILVEKKEFDQLVKLVRGLRTRIRNIEDFVGITESTTTTSTSTTTTSTTTSTSTTTTTTQAYDVDAQAYFDAVITAGGTLSTADKNAWNTYVLAKKADNTWSKRKLILPYMGGTAAAHAIDAKTATTKVTWNGTLTHNGSGVQSNGSTGYGDVNFNPTTDFSSTLVGCGVYVRNTTQAPALDLGVEQNSGAGAFAIQTNANGGTGGTSVVKGMVGDYNNNVFAGSISDGTGPFIGWNAVNKISNTSLKYHRNGSTFNTNTSSNTGALTNGHVYVNAVNIIGTGAVAFSPNQHCMVQFWEGMTEAEVNNDNTDIEALQDALSRGVQ